MQVPESLKSGEFSALSAEQLLSIAHTQAITIEQLKQRIAWFERQIFGQKSERLTLVQNSEQLALGQLPGAGASAAAGKRHTVVGHTRRAVQQQVAEAESVPFFDESRVPIQLIPVPNPELQGLSSEQYEIISEKITWRLAQRPGSYVLLKYVRQVVKRCDTQGISCPPAPAGIIEGSRAEVSFLAGLLLEKFAYHTPLYRQHQRLTDAGIRVSRPWLTQLTQAAIGLLEPIYAAQLDSVRNSRVLAMDETPIKAGPAGHGKMKTGYFWPIYGEQDEVCFPFFPSRAAAHVRTALGVLPGEDRVLLSDGYAAYQQYAKKLKITHAQCWAHTRRAFFEAQAADPEAVQQALEQIAELYEIETQIRTTELTGNAKRQYRQIRSAPKVEAFFAWVDQQLQRQGLLPSSPFTQALAYARERRLGLSVFLEDPEVPMDTNHLERALRVIPMGRRNWLFCWTEMGAHQVGIIHSLISTCRLHELNPYDYLVDVLQRVGQHPAARVAELTPRLWKQHFALSPLRSDLHIRSG